MPISFRILAPRTSLRPQLACEIAPEGVVAARQSADRGKSGGSVVAFAPLPAGTVNPGLAEANFTDPQLVVGALRQALDELGGREKQLTLVIPDAAVRVLLMDFDTLPSKVQEALPIVRFRLKKLAPFEVDDAAVSYQILRQSPDQTRVLATVMPAAVRAEYESAVRAAGYEPGVVLPATLASLASLPSEGASLVISRNGHSLTTAITRGDELLLHRTLELPPSDDWDHQELAKSVSVAMAYFEDTLQMQPGVLNYVGPGGAREFMRALGPVIEEYGLEVRDLVPEPAFGALTPMAQGLVAGVAGALTN